MARARFVVMATLVVAVGYAATPYLFLWRLSGALERADARALERMVDWDSVRSGLKQDIAEGIVGAPEEAEAGLGRATPGQAVASVVSNPANTLPPFGASFVSGIAGTMVDREVTPQHLVATVQLMEPAASPAASPLAALGGVDSAFFDGPTSFVLRVRCPGQEADEEPLRLRLALGIAGWRVVRAWIPQDLIDRTNSRT